MVRPTSVPCSPNPHAEPIAQKALESFAARILGDRNTATIQTAELARDGYDVGMLMDFIDDYASVPVAERRFHFEKDFAKLGSRDEFGLHIRRL